MNFIGPHRKTRDDLSTSTIDAYTRFVSDNLVRISRLQPEDPGKTRTNAPFHADAEACSVAEFTVARITTRSGRTRSDRTAADIFGDTERRYIVCLLIDGEVEAQQFVRHERYLPGSIVMMSGSEPLSFWRLGDTDMFVLMLPQSFVEGRLMRAEDFCCRQLTKPEGVTSLVRAAVAGLHGAARQMNEGDLRKAVTIVGELILLALGNLADAKSSASPVRSANLMRAKRIIRAKCDNPDLTLANVAEECGLSLRYLHDLFREDGRTLREYILYERLQRARRMLEVGSPINTKVTEVCLASGFSNLSHFCTAFRRAFSVSPGEVLRGG